MYAVTDVLLFRAPGEVFDPQRVLDVPTAHNYVRYTDLRARLNTMDLAVTTRQVLSVETPVDVVTASTECVSATYFPVLGVRSEVGRTIGPPDDQPGAPLVVAVSNEFWKTQLSRTQAVVGTPLTIGGRVFNVIGVMPAGFRGVDLGDTDLWISVAAAPQLCSPSGGNFLWSDSAHWLRTIGRLHLGVSPAQAQAELQSIAGASSVPRLQSIVASRRYAAGSAIRLAAWLTAGSAVLVLLSCVNISGLLSIRAVDRRQEIAIRWQLGARGSSILTQLLVEQLAITVVGGFVAVCVSLSLWHWLSEYFRIPHTQFLFNGRVLGCLLGLLVLACTLSCLTPVIQTAMVVARKADALRGSILPGARYRTLLLSVQVTIAFTLLTAAGMFSESVRNVTRDLGYEPTKVLVATLDLARSNLRRETDARQAFALILGTLRSHTDVGVVALTSAPPLDTGSFSVVIPDSPGRNARRALTRFVSYVSPDYFAAIGTPILRGRPFAEKDTVADRVAIIDSGLANEIEPTKDVVGKCVAVNRADDCFTIIGVTQPRRIESLRRANGELFLPITGSEGRESMPQALIIRPKREPRLAAPALVEMMRGAVPHLPAVTVWPLDQLVDDRARAWLVGARMFTLFGLAAAAIASLSIYGAVGFTTRRRTAEFGMRMALGAEHRTIVGLAIRQLVIAMLVGAVAGITLSIVGGHLMQHLLFNVAPIDTVALAVSCGVIMCAGILGCIGPALSVMRLDPVLALRRDE